MKDVWFDLPEWNDQPRRVTPIPGLGTPARNNAEFPDWVTHVARHVAEVNQHIRQRWSGQQRAIELEAQRIRADGRYWVNVHAGIYEARTDEDDDTPRGLLTPFILYPFQDWLWDWNNDRMKAKGRMGDGVKLKSRDMGVTNLDCVWFAHRWMTQTPFQGRLLSRKEDLVDDKYQPDSMMWKIEYFIKSTYKPIFDRLVPNFTWTRHRNDNKLANPNNSNLISGESTNATAGRGGRCTAMLLDEFGYMRNPRGIYTSTRSSTRHRFFDSTPATQEGLFFHDLVEDSPSFPADRKPCIIRVENSLHPWHDATWLAHERERDTEEGIRQEIFLEWFADTTDYVYPGLRRHAVGDFPYVPWGGPLFAGIDDGRDNDWATLWIQLIEATGRLRVVEAHKRRGMIADFYGTIYTGFASGKYEYTDEDRRVMAWTRQAQTPTWFGDAHGDEVQVTSGLSAYGVLQDNWGITVNIDYDRKTRGFMSRIQAVGDLMDRLDWNDTPAVRIALADCQRHKWKRVREGAELTSEYRTPAHGPHSHSPAALETFACQWWQWKDILTAGSGFMYYQDDDEQISSNADLDARRQQPAVLSYADIR